MNPIFLLDDVKDIIKVCHLANVDSILGILDKMCYELGFYSDDGEERKNNFFKVPVRAIYENQEYFADKMVDILESFCEGHESRYKEEDY